jgi:hypothetical protein
MNLIFGKEALTMRQSILRIVLTTLALVLLFAGSFNLNRTRAQQEFEVMEGGGGGGGSFCAELGCSTGPNICAMIQLSDGTRITCFMP